MSNETELQRGTRVRMLHKQSEIGTVVDAFHELGHLRDPPVASYGVRLDSNISTIVRFAPFELEAFVPPATVDGESCPEPKAP